MKENAPGYTAADITTLEAREHVRHRVGMYLGSNSSLVTYFREVLDNSVDEAIEKHGNEIRTVFYADGSAEVTDYGRGLPTDKNVKGINGIILTVGTTGSGGKFNSKNYSVSGGLNGVGAAAANFTSQRFDVTVYREGEKHELSFRQGVPGHWAKPNDPLTDFTPSTEIKVSTDPRSATERKQHPTGTTIRMWPDRSVFTADAGYELDEMKFRIRSTAFLVPGLKLVITDHTGEGSEPVVDEYQFDDGVMDMLPTLSAHSFVTKPIHISTDGSFTLTTNVMDENNEMHQREVERKVNIEVAYAYTNVEETTLKSYVNIINTKNGGTHESGMWRALSRVWVNHIKNTKGYLKAKEEPPTLDDVKDGFNGVISLKFSEPVFTGQEKSTLATQEITSVVSQAVGAELQKWIDLPKNKNEVKRVGIKIVEASRVRLAAKASKDTARKKSALESAASLPTKLVACSSNVPEDIELQICEGLSALGGLKNSRSSKTVAIYPLKGKPLNVYDAPLGAILENQEWADLIQIVGAGVGKSFDLDQMRYHKIILLSDSDVDGAHINVLLISGLWRLMRPMVEAGRLYVALPPLFSVTTTGRNKERFYARNEEERDKLLKRLDKTGKTYGKVQRHKGLGEYSDDILAEVVMDPETRTLKQITVDDVKRFEDILELTMGKNASDRRDWIVENRSMVSDDDLDM